jgi:hypothetical protein
VGTARHTTYALLVFLFPVAACVGGEFQPPRFTTTPFSPPAHPTTPISSGESNLPAPSATPHKPSPSTEKTARATPGDTTPREAERSPTGNAVAPKIPLYSQLSETPVLRVLPGGDRGAENPQTGEFFAPRGKGFVSTKDGTFYAPAGPFGLVNTKTGEFLLVR